MKRDMNINKVARILAAVILIEVGYIGLKLIFDIGNHHVGYTADWSGPFVWFVFFGGAALAGFILGRIR